MPRNPEYEGRRLRITCLTLSNGECPAGAFLAGLSDGDRQKFDVLFERLGNEGRIANQEHFRKLDGTDGIWEFKRFQLRLFCFFAPDKTVYLLYGLTKKKDKHKKADLLRAEEYKADFDSRHTRRK